MSTRYYPEEAQARLGAAVEQARLAAGIPTREAFAAKAGISVRNLIYLEQADRPVGQKTLFAVARALLPSWSQDTPRIILEGGPIPEPVAEASLRRPLTGIEKQIFSIYLEQLRSRVPEPEAMRRIKDIAVLLKQDADLIAAAIKRELERID